MLTQQQQAVVDWCLDDSGRKHAVVVARAGTGKTFVLKQCIAALNEAGIGDIAVCAYNRAIADEIKDDIKRPTDKGGLGITDWRVVEANTVHSFALRAWRKVCQNIEIDDKKIYKICDREAALIPNGDEEFSRVMLKELAGSIDKTVSLAKNTCIGIKTGLDDKSAWYDMVDHYALHDADDYGVEEFVAGCIFVLKKSIEQDYEVINFDDMIYAPLYHRAKMWFWPKRFVMVDEAQDLSMLRRLFAYALAGKTGRMVFVGDDRQAIYGFSGASANSLDEIENHLQAKRLYLTKTWRCGKRIVQAAKRLVPDYEAADTNSDGKIFKDQWPEKLGAGDAIISRKNADLVAMAYQFMAKGIGCRVEGREIGGNLKRLATRWKRIKTIAALMTQLDVYMDRETDKWMSRDKPEKLEQIQDQVDCLKVIMNRCIDLGLGHVTDVVDQIDGMFGNNVEDVLVLTTAHKSKGREWDRVVLYKANEIETSPWDRREWQTQQSLNLSYVAITRAKEELYIN